MTRIQAFTTHLITSLLVVFSVAAIALWIWYPDFYASTNNIWQPLSIMIGVDAVLGPVMMLILFKPGKPGLKFDVAVILTIQIIALAGAASLLYLERPKLTVYYDGMFVCLSSNNVNAINVDPEQFMRDDFLVPQAYLPEPSNIADQRAWDQRLSELPDGSLMLPPYVFGDKFEAIGSNGLAAMQYEDLDLTKVIAEDSEYYATWQKFAQKHGEKINDYIYLSMTCSVNEHLAAVDRKTGAIIDAVAIPSLNTTKKRILN
ncbi:hypothetical protein [Candidatus Albibeggiatoa sp. nov. NOAA]|uniref:hypothetical protein n=1 Tax=Candidatus Albibeggiatoa sp. nov. NOAA TaxID=3162724 RepID=UPI003303C784|nr:hypothetical protein [Thiotrichaceae bacterium]